MGQALRDKLLPGKVGTMSGLFFGLAFGLGGLALPFSARSRIARASSSSSKSALICPLIGLLTAFLPDLGNRRRA